MVYKKSYIITESERNRIKSLYNINNNVNTYVITEWLSPDEKFVIFLDELYDLENKTKIGDIWENVDNFKFFIKHSFEVAKNVPQEIMESVQSSLDKLVLLESNKNYSNLKLNIKEYLLNEDLGDWISGAGEWLKDTAKSTAQGVGDFVTKSFEGIKSVVKGITSGEWTEVLNLLKKGTLWIARKIREALYSPVGLILDAILVATGIGKGAQVIAWGIVVALDLYELISGNYENKEESFIIRLLFTGIDFIGLVFAGLAAKESKGVVGGVIKKFGTTTEGLSKAAKSNSAFKSILEKMMTSAQSASGKMGEVVTFLQKKSPKMYEFVKSILGGLTKFVNKIIDTISKILGVGKKIISTPGKTIEKTFGTGELGKGVKSGVETTGIVGGLGTYGKVKQAKSEEEIFNALKNSNIQPDYTNLEI
jgi:hypothetical protein